MFYGRLLLDRLARQLRGLVSETPKPSDRRQSATNTCLGDCRIRNRWRWRAVRFGRASKASQFASAAR
jgi:hypothetical protein